MAVSVAEYFGQRVDVPVSIKPISKEQARL